MERSQRHHRRLGQLLQPWVGAFHCYVASRVRFGLAQVFGLTLFGEKFALVGGDVRFSLP